MNKQVLVDTTGDKGGVGEIRTCADGIFQERQGIGDWQKAEGPVSACAAKSDDKADASKADASEGCADTG
jgi:hypothetical protein